MEDGRISQLLMLTVYMRDLKKCGGLGQKKKKSISMIVNYFGRLDSATVGYHECWSLPWANRKPSKCFNRRRKKKQVVGSMISRL